LSYAGRKYKCIGTAPQTYREFNNVSIGQDSTTGKLVNESEISAILFKKN
jgi:hypothetical protein